MVPGIVFDYLADPDQPGGTAFRLGIQWRSRLFATDRDWSAGLHRGDSRRFRTRKLGASTDAHPAARESGRCWFPCKAGARCQATQACPDFPAGPLAAGDHGPARHVGGEVRPGRASQASGFTLPCRAAGRTSGAEPVPGERLRGGTLGHRWRLPLHLSARRSTGDVAERRHSEFRRDLITFPVASCTRAWVSGGC